MATTPRSAPNGAPDAAPAGRDVDESQSVPWWSGFTGKSTVKVSKSGGADVPRNVTFLGPQRLGATLEEDDVATPGLLVFTVANPEPGGGVSKPLQVTIGAVDGHPEPGPSSSTSDERDVQ